MLDLERCAPEQLSLQDQLRVLVNDFQSIAAKKGEEDKKVVEALRLYWRIVACRYLSDYSWDNFSTEVADVLFSMSARKNGRVVRGKPMNNFVRKHFESDMPFLLEGLEGKQKERAKHFCQTVLSSLKG